MTAACTTGATAAEMRLEDAWMRLVPGSDAAGYLRIVNATDRDDRLLAASADRVAAVEFHETSIEGGISKMGQLAEIEVPARATVVLEPGGLHLMLLGPEAGLVAGEVVHLTLTFARAGEVTVDATVRDR